ncbi:MAG: IS1 family transposase [Chloroflexi bacterium]|nr:IS1 family transposase [Chloroflexota bacterium]
MNPQDIFCPNMDCPARGQTGKGNIHVHSQQDQRYLCEVCEQTFSASKGTIFYRLRTDPKTVMGVIVLLTYGCPIQAIVKAFDLDERTVRDWQQRAGKHCQGVHEHLVESSQLDLQQVQADEIRVKTQKGVFWMAMALIVSTRLWLGGVVSPKRDLDLIQSLADKVRRMALCRPLLLAVDGLVSYVTAFRNAFRSKFPRERGEKGRCKMVSWSDIAIVQVVKQRAEGVLTIERRIVQGTKEMVQRLIKATQGQGVINTAFIERINATFRQRMSSLVRHTRTLARRADTLVAGMYLVGCFYNFCDFHHSLRLKLSVGNFGHRWVQRTPAIAAGLTDHPWTAAELLTFKVPPPRWEPPKQRGRPSLALLQLAQQWAI